MDKLYDITCSECGWQGRIQKSIFHDMGLYDHVRADCPGCNAKLNIIYNPETDSMRTRNYDLFIKGIKDGEDK